MIFLVINKNSGAIRASEINRQPTAASCPNHYWESSAALSLSHIRMLCLVTQSFLTLWTQWTVTCHAPLSIGFSRQDYWNGLTCPLLGDLPDLGIEPVSLKSPELAGGFFTTSSTWEGPCCHILLEYNLPLDPFAVMQFLAPGQKLTFLNKALVFPQRLFGVVLFLLQPSKALWVSPKHSCSPQRQEWKKDEEKSLMTENLPLLIKFNYILSQRINRKFVSLEAHLSP